MVMLEKLSVNYCLKHMVRRLLPSLAQGVQMWSGVVQALVQVQVYLAGCRHKRYLETWV